MLIIMLPKLKIISFRIIIVLAIFSSSSQASAPGETGIAETSAVIRGEKINVRINCAENIDFKILSDEVGRAFVGTDGEPPICIFREFHVDIGGRAIAVPKRAIADLSNVRIDRAEINEQNGRLFVGLNGGDGLGAYYVRFIFEKKILVRREITDRDDQENVRKRVKKFAAPAAAR